MASWLFGYGSLVCRPSLVEFLGREIADDNWAIADLAGYRRLWNAAMDNTRNDPGTRFWADADGFRHHGTVTYLGLAEDAGARANGAVFRVSAAELALFDRRELRYRRAEVTHGVTTAAGAPDGDVFTYLPRDDAVARHERSAAAGTDRIAHWYLERVVTGFGRVGPDYLDEYHATTVEPPSPVAELYPQRIHP